MTLDPRAKVLLVIGGFALPIVASYLVLQYGHPRATANYGELLLPPDSITAAPFSTMDGRDFRFTSLGGRWVMVTSDRMPCDAACGSKLAAIRQVRLALGKDAERVATVAVVQAGPPPDAALRKDFPDLSFVRAAAAAAGGATADPAHIYLVDPHGNVMMRWPAQPDYKRMKGDLDRLLRASQIG